MKATALLLLLLTACGPRHQEVRAPVNPRGVFDAMEIAYLRAKLQEAPTTTEAMPVVPAVPQLTAKEIISILADYDFKHVDQQPFFQPAFGVTNFDSSPPAIWIFNTGDTPSKRSTVIHELLHVHYHQLGLDPPEEYIRSEESRLYLEIFGGSH